jgi:hypothetical protein
VTDLSALVISDPSTHHEVEAIRQKLNQLISALRR